jgi:hypothetical protein
MEKILLPFEKKLPSTDIKFLAVSEELVHHPVRELERLLNEPDRVPFHEKQFHILGQREKERLIDFMQRTKGQYLEQYDIAATRTRLGLVAEQCQKNIMETEDVLDLFRELIQQIKQCANAISNKSGLKVTFNDEAIDWILSHKTLTPEAIKELCGGLLKSFEYGLELLSQKKQFTEVVIPVAGLESPDTFINELVAKSFIEKKT